ncbi:MAG: flagellar filament capping protein FliD [Pseudomonadales bacterium]
MASIQSLGIGSGLLTSELVDDIVAAERKATDLRIEAQKAEFEAKVSAFGSVRSSVSQLISATGKLSSSSGLLANTATSSNPAAVTATATAAAVPGVHSVEVLSLARAHTLASIRFEDLDSVVGDGSLTFRFGTTTFDGSGNYDSFTENPDRAEATVTIPESSNSLLGVRDAINEAGIGVAASIVNDGEGYVLVLTSERSGEANGMEITVSEGTTPGLEALSFNSTASTPGSNMTQTVAADDARLIIDGIQVRRDSNTVSEVVEGVTFNALSLNPGAPATLSIAQDTQGIVDNMRGFVDAYNAVKSLTDQLTAFDEESSTGSLLMGDATLRGIRSQLRQLLSSSVMGLESTALRSLVDLGLSTDQNNEYQLTLNETKLTRALQQHPGDVAALLADQKRASDDLIRFVSFQKPTAAGEYDVEISRLATRGVLQGAAVAGLAGPISIDADNDTLSVVVDGASSGTITLAQGSYADGAALAQALQTQINADAALTAAGRSVQVTYNSVDGRFEITSASYGSKSQVGISGVDVNTAQDLGLSVATGEASRGVDVAGTINGIAGTGSGQFLALPLGPVPATAGVYRGAGVTSFDAPPVTLDPGNSTFSLAVDGITSGTIALTQGDYASGADLAAEIEAQINADTALAAAGVGVEVSFDGVNGRFVIASASTGRESTVNMVAVPPGTQALLGFATGAGTPGEPAREAADAAAGIQIQVLGGATGARGSVTLVRGAMNRLGSYLDSVVRFDGTLNNKLDTLQARLSDLDKEAADFEKRMGKLEDRLRLQFAAADALISQLNSTSSYLDQQLKTLPGYSNKNN